MRGEKQWWELMPCGTDAAYRRHRRHGEEACPACKEAHSLYVTHQRPSRALYQPDHEEHSATKS